MIQGFKGTSLIDYPGKMASVLYTKGCNFRCPFCHNHSLVLPENMEEIPLAELIETLSARRGFIDGVVITGGEPTIHSNLRILINSVKQLGLSIKLDTNGSRPEALRELIENNLIDYVAMDIKSSFPRYCQAAGVAVDANRIIESIELIKNAGIQFEFRTTCVPVLLDGNDIAAISQLVGFSGRYTLQQFQPVDTLDSTYRRMVPYTKEVLLEFLEIARRSVATCRLIGIP